MAVAKSFFVTRMLTRDLFAVLNISVGLCIRKCCRSESAPCADFIHAYRVSNLDIISRRPCDAMRRRGLDLIKLAYDPSSQ